ncbi:MAG: ATP-binding cassette domain-containing protein [Mycoplasmatales bacterium]
MEIKLQDVTYNKFDYCVVCDITHTFKSSYTSIIGPSGSGKTTLISLLNGLLLPSSGTINLDNFSINNKTKLKEVSSLKTKVCIVHQFSDLQIFNETVKKELLYGVNNFSLDLDSANKHIKKYFKIFDLDLSILDRSPNRLSGGQRKKVAIISMLLLQPEVLILDEPTIGLDPQSQQQIMDAIKSLEKEMKIILICHDMDIIYKYTKEIMELSYGKLYKSLSKEKYFESKFIDQKYLLLPTKLRFGSIYNNSLEVYNRLINNEDLIDIIKEKND